MCNKLIRIKKIYFNAVHGSNLFFLLVTASNFLWLLTDTWWLTAWRYPCDNWRLRHLCYSSQGWHDTDRKWWKNGRLLSAPIFVVTLYLQCAKKVMSDSPGLVDFTTGLGNPVLNLKGKWSSFGKFKLQKNCNQCCSSKSFFWHSWASTYQQQLAQMASRKTDFLCTLISAL